MMTRVYAGVLGILMILAVPVTSAGERVNEVRDASPNGFIHITVVRGEINIEGWDRNQVSVSGELDERTEEFVFDVRKDDVVIEVKLPRNLKSWSNSEGSDLDIRVPRGSNVDVRVVSTDVRVEDIQGGVEVDGVSGDLRLRNLNDRVDVTVVSGDIELTDATGRIKVGSVSGDLDLRDLSGDMRLHTVSGDVVARNLKGEIDVESVSGDIELMDAVYRALSGHTVSGDVDVSGELEAGGGFEFDTVSGSVRVTFKVKPDARFDLETASGSIRNGLTSHRPVTSKYVRDKKLRFVLGEGVGEVTIGTRSGDIVIDR